MMSVIALYMEKGIMIGMAMSLKGQGKSNKNKLTCMIRHTKKPKRYYVKSVASDRPCLPQREKVVIVYT